jgi:ZIP family zinc transporter
MNGIVEALIITTLAGLATGVGGLIAFVKKPSQRMIGVMMGMAAGVMITLAFMELLVEAIVLIGLETAALGFIAGSFLMLALDSLLPHIHFGTGELGRDINSVCEEEEPQGPGEGRGGRWRHRQTREAQLLMYSSLIGIGIALHNFPEGIAMGSSFAHMPELGMVMAIAIALHNLPEGMVIVLPACLAGMKRKRALKLAFLSGLAEPLGAITAFMLLDVFPNIIPLGLSFAAGVMVAITLDEIVPIANREGHEHLTSFGFLLGCAATFVLLAMLL